MLTSPVSVCASTASHSVAAAPPFPGTWVSGISVGSNPLQLLLGARHVPAAGSELTARALPMGALNLAAKSTRHIKTEMVWVWGWSQEQGCGHGTASRGKGSAGWAQGGGGVSIITRERSEVKNEPANVDRNSCHEFLFVPQTHEYITERAYVPFFPLQTLMEHATEIFPWHTHTHTHSPSNPFPACMSEKAISGT